MTHGWRARCLKTSIRKRVSKVIKLARNPAGEALERADCGRKRTHIVRVAAHPSLMRRNCEIDATGNQARTSAQACDRTPVSMQYTQSRSHSGPANH